MSKLNEYGYEGPLILEVGKEKNRPDLSNEEYLAVCYERLSQLSKMG
jgi:hypothetical protein